MPDFVIAFRYLIGYRFVFFLCLSVCVDGHILPSLVLMGWCKGISLRLPSLLHMVGWEFLPTHLPCMLLPACTPLQLPFPTFSLPF